MDKGDFELGESIAVNGVCLTVDAFGGDAFDTDVSPETLLRSNLGRVRSGDSVNLERALRPIDRLGGHFVLGHVDGVGRMTSRQPQGEFEVLWFSAPDEVARYLVEKGSVTIDGVSLTVATVSGGEFSVAVIPHTLSRTTLAARQAGYEVNLEADVLGKYVEKLLGAPRSGGLTMESLAQNGFLR
jgi:riboflavin synthase